MQLFISTTFYDSNPTDLAEILQLIHGLDVDGLELGSTHYFRKDIETVVNNSCDHRIVTHNFFPPTENPDFVINIASEDAEIRNASIAHARHCISVASRLGAEVYTVHPGFLAKPVSSIVEINKYDFDFNDERTEHKIAFALMIDALCELSNLAIKKGIKLAIETEGSLTRPGVLLMETLDEYEQLFSIIPDNIFLNMNLAHTRFAAKAHNYSMNDFIDRYRNRIILVEISHNDGVSDQHLPLTKDSYIFDYLDSLPNVPYILEFRNAEINQVQKSIALMRAHS